MATTRTPVRERHEHGYDYTNGRLTVHVRRCYAGDWLVAPEPAVTDFYCRRLPYAEACAYARQVLDQTEC